MKIIIGSHLTIAAKLSSDWGPPLLALMIRIPSKVPDALLAQLAWIIHGAL